MTTDLKVSPQSEVTTAFFTGLTGTLGRTDCQSQWSITNTLFSRANKTNVSQQPDQRIGRTVILDVKQTLHTLATERKIFKGPDLHRMVLYQ